MATASKPVDRNREIDSQLNQTNAQVLKTFFNSKFTSNTQKAAALKLAKRDCDVMLSFSTEHERTMTYQLAAVVQAPKLTIVFCNNITRIKKNVTDLANLNIHAEILTYQTTLPEKKRIYKVLFSKQIVTNFLYMTPDQIANEQFVTLVIYLTQRQHLAYIVVDETHNELEWLFGEHILYHEFGILKKLYMNIPWIVVMGPANIDIVNDIKKVLKLRVTTFTRFSDPCFKPNTFYDVVFEDGFEDLTKEIVTFVGQCVHEYPNTDDYPVYQIRGLIFCSSEEECRKVAHCLTYKGTYNVVPFYKSMTHFEKFKIKLGILKGLLKVITVTGLDDLDLKVDNVRFTIHLFLPHSLTKYFWESNLAGRNGKDSKCRIYITRKSISDQKNFTATFKADEEDEDVEKYKKLLKNRLDIMNYCESSKCRHQLFAEHFGDPKPLCFNKCDNEANDRDIDKRPTFLKTIQLKDRLLKKLLCTTSRPLDSDLKLLENACLMARLISEFENLKSTDPESATVTEANKLMKSCEKLISESELADSEEPTNGEL